MPTTLPARYFTDPEIFGTEMERWFVRNWVYAGTASQIPNPGDYLLVDVVGESLIITRGNDGEIRAFFNVCRHRGTRMCTVPLGNFRGRIQCPYHGWTYALDGRLIGAPHMDISGFSRDDYPLHEIDTEVWNGQLFISLQKPENAVAARLIRLGEKFASWQMPDLVRVKRIVYDVRANWKLLILNYNECLHCPVLHPALNRLTDYLGAGNEPPTADYIGGSMGFRGGAQTMSMDGIRRRNYLPGLNEEERAMVCYYAIFPNLLLSLHPDYMLTHTLWPKTVDRTEVVCEWHFHPNEIARPDFHADDAVDFWDLTNKEDWGISELSQAGISSRAYTPGPYSPRESLLHAFDCTITQRSGVKHDGS